ncbi:synaptonemal complex central element protein 1-like isoform X1 [Montipora capricornis]|uniref:synaptonemal complex central element protein 1-like isoform X1 n=2 Tax=Montipora capricornis TaxID=246305 RepID=UPI0035F1DE85
MSGVAGSSSPNFRIDVIVNSLRELQQEKERLQQHCNEERARCKSLEMKLDACQVKYFQSKERNCKMLETVNAAKQKVLQTQIQANRLKELNDEKGVKIQELRKEISEEIKKEQTELAMFEEQLFQLTDKFRNAKNYYTEENVQQEIEHWSKQAECVKNDVSREDGVLQELTTTFHQLEMENKRAKDEVNNKFEFGLTHEELKSTLKVFEEMNQETKDKLEISKQQLEQDLKRLDQAKQGHKDRNLEIPLQSQERINLNQPDTLTVNDAAPHLSETSSIPADQLGYVLDIDSNPEERHKQKGGNHNGDHTLNSSAVVQTRDGAEQEAEIQSDAGKKTSFQGRSFFISLPVTKNH